MKLTTASGLKSEIFVPITPKPVWTELKKPLSECKVAFITAGGIHKKDQVPFNTAGDYTYRPIPSDTPTSQLMVTHGGFDNSDINKDVNAMFPLDRLRELVEEGFIGSLADEMYGFMGGGGNVDKFKNETGPEIASKLKAQGVDIVLCTGGCGTCHRSATIVTRACEEAGMSCIVIAALPPIAQQQGAPRIAAAHVPIGSNAGEPNNIEMQMGILKDSLQCVAEFDHFGQLKLLPYEYRHNV
ncbi:D-proline reductase (dithiol) protein PrdB [Clostridium tyrobutyricum]|jgi:D-proline reductase (dithiol) PrdB|uniref:D-proline reductase, 26 kDa subunit @ selenocysteine-containing n=2 Tax=Clostridium tyrobutyricum TaxID=1519 RepID=W6N4A9_CLOTY|nr:D-proline reductase (dithiol) protein PrdB [Clostridium tyrobutyricum]AIZ03770.1 D-proline reductase [Clostridium tyrobutyricum]AND83559.1 D-proline reductase, 26 kDa subunit [Clostridium tyrobutyricum]ANP68344.1 D-proline reductase (dithiol) protein PrdB [Clostridium tyrobutyricum]MBR9648784.1 D-proline reductase (dithiol) protein PrdB [Clostridium tyrobutyricum]MBV4415809.1 D-proline reductase (dithiol) protein PrdB [Clostridium tyrobutyricum]